ncbi:MAG: hypothetical protein JNK26_04330 [Candidatus Doudnabacteria bacterium]|nr:hypothetical protein [Candidatus Doudnabacteria bacterium]
MDSRQRDTYLLAGVIGLLVIMLIAVGVLLSGGRKQNHTSAYEGLTY